jgi:hypothetical protein
LRRDDAPTPADPSARSAIAVRFLTVATAVTTLSEMLLRLVERLEDLAL